MAMPVPTNAIDIVDVICRH